MEGREERVEVEANSSVGLSVLASEHCPLLRFFPFTNDLNISPFCAAVNMGAQEDIEVGIIGMGDMGRLYATKLAAAGWK